MADTEDQVIEPVVVDPAHTENTPEPEPVEPTAGGDATPAAEPVAEEPPKKPKNEPWYMKRINQQSAKIADVSRNSEMTVAELAAARAEIAALKASRVADPANTERPLEQPRPVENLTSAQVTAEAQRIVAAQQFNAACDRVYDDGKSQFDDFDDAVKMVGATGVLTQPFLEAVTSLDNSAKVLYHLGKDPDEAARIAALSPTKQAVELAKLDMSVAKVAPKQVSKAPAPIKPVGGAARTSPELSEEDSIEVWMDKRRAQLAKRNA